MPDDEQEKRDFSEETAGSDSAQSQTWLGNEVEIKRDNEETGESESLESTLKSGASTESSEQSEITDFISKRIQTITEIGSQIYDEFLKAFVQAPSSSKRGQLLDSLLDKSSTENIMSSEERQSIQAANLLESLVKLQKELGGSSPESRRERLLALRTLASVDSGSEAGAPAVDNLMDSLAQMAPPHLRKEIDWTLQEKSLANGIVEERVNETLDEIFSGNDVQDNLKQLRAYNRAHCRNGDFQLEQITQLAADCSKIVLGSPPGLRIIDVLNETAPFSAGAKSILQAMETAGVVVREPGSNKYTPVGITEITGRQVWDFFRALKPDASKQDDAPAAGLIPLPERLLDHGGLASKAETEAPLASKKSPNSPVDFVDEEEMDRIVEELVSPSHGPEQSVRSPGGAIYEYGTEVPPKLKSVTNPDGTYVKLDDSMQVTEFRGSDGVICKLSPENKQWLANVAFDSLTGLVQVTQKKFDTNGDITTIYHDGSMDVEARNGSRRKYDNHGRLTEALNGLTGETMKIRWHEQGHPQAGKVAVIEGPGGQEWTQGSDGQWRTKSGKSCEVHLADSAESTNAAHFRINDSKTELHWSSDKPAEVVDFNECLTIASSVRELINSRGSIDIFEQLLEGKSENELEKIKEQYFELTGTKLIERVHALYSGSHRLRARAAMGANGPVSSSAERLAVAFTEASEAWVDRSASLSEIRSILASRSAVEMEQIRRELPKILATAGLRQESLDQAIDKFPEPHKAICKILSKGADQLKYEDFNRLSELAIENGSEILLCEIWQNAGAANRKRFCDSGGKDRVKGALSGWLSPNGADKILDVLDFGFVGADKHIAAAKGFFGSIEKQIELAIEQMPQREKDLFQAGERLHRKYPDGQGLPGEDKLAFERYTKIHAALKVRCYELDACKWEERIKGQGATILEDIRSSMSMFPHLAAMRRLENMSALEFNRIQQSPEYRDLIARALRSHLPGAPDDPESPIGKCLGLLERKASFELDFSSLKGNERERFERGRDLAKQRFQERLDENMRKALDTYNRVGPNPPPANADQATKDLWKKGQQIQSDLDAVKFYQQRSFEAAAKETRRDIFGVLNDMSESQIGTLAYPQALEAMSADERAKLSLSAKNIPDVSKLSETERKQYMEAVRFRDQLHKTLDTVLGRDAATREEASRVLERIARQDKPASLLDKLNARYGGVAQACADIKQELAEKPELAALGKLICASRKDTIENTVAALPADKQDDARRLLVSMRRALGEGVFSKHGMNLLNGTFSGIDQLSLRRGYFSNDTSGMCHDLASMSAGDRAHIAALLDQNKFNALLKGKSPAETKELQRQAEIARTTFENLSLYEKQIFKNALAKGMQPEDWIRRHVGGDYDGTDEEGIKDVFAKLTNRVETRKELSQRSELKGKTITDEMVTAEINRKLTEVAQRFVHKYGMDLKMTLINELAGADLQRSLRLAAKQSDNANQIVLKEQSDFFQRLGLGSSFVDAIGYGASTSLGKAALDRIVAMQALERMGGDKFDSERARELASQLFEASLEMTSSQNELSDTAIDIAINVGCVLATVPTGGASLAALGASIPGKAGMALRSVGRVLEVMDKAMKSSSAISRTEILTEWFKNASMSEQMIALGMVGGLSKTGIKSAVVGGYDASGSGLQDFISGFSDMALNVDIPLGKWGRSAVGRTSAELGESMSRPAGQGAADIADLFNAAVINNDCRRVLEEGFEQAARSAFDQGGEVSQSLMRELAERLVRDDAVNREQVVQQLAEQMHKRLTEAVQKDMQASTAFMEALAASKQGVLAGGVGSLAYLDPDASASENFMSVGISALSGGALNFGMTLPLELAGRFANGWSRRAPGGHEPRPSETVGPHTAGSGNDAALPVNNSATPEQEHRPGARGDVIPNASNAAAYQPAPERQPGLINQIAVHMNYLRAWRDQFPQNHPEYHRLHGMHLQERRRLYDELNGELEQSLRRMGMSEAEAHAVTSSGILVFGQLNGEMGVFRQHDGLITLDIDAILLHGEDVNSVMQHELRHLLNSVQRKAAFQSQPELAMRIVIDDCTRGMFGGGHRISYDAASGGYFSSSRPDASNFSGADVSFAQTQLKEYLSMFASQGLLPDVPDEATFRAWLASRQPPQVFPNSNTERLLLREIIAEISSARLVVSNLCTSNPAAGVVALERFFQAQKSAGDPNLVRKVMQGSFDSATGLVNKDYYWQNSLEEIQARTSQLRREYQQNTLAIANVFSELTERLNRAGVKPEWNEQFKSLCAERAKLELERNHARSVHAADPVSLRAELDRIDTKQMKLTESILREVMGKTGGKNRLLETIAKHPEYMNDPAIAKLIGDLHQMSTRRDKVLERYLYAGAQTRFAKELQSYRSNDSSDPAVQEAARARLREAAVHLLERTSAENFSMTVDQLHRLRISPEDMLSCRADWRVPVAEEFARRGMDFADIVQFTPPESRAQVAMHLVTNHNVSAWAAVDMTPPESRGLVAQALLKAGHSLDALFKGAPQAVCTDLLNQLQQLGVRVDDIIKLTPDKSVPSLAVTMARAGVPTDAILRSCPEQVFADVTKELLTAGISAEDILKATPKGAIPVAVRTLVKAGVSPDAIMDALPPEMFNRMMLGFQTAGISMKDVMQAGRDKE